MVTILITTPVVGVIAFRLMLFGIGRSILAYQEYLEVIKPR